MVQRIVPGEPITGQQALDKKAVQFAGAWLAQMHEAGRKFAKEHPEKAA